MRKTLLIFSQVFLPDPASVGQHVADVATEMVRRGWRVIVYAANRGYEDPSVRYAARKVIAGVEIRRLPLCSFGKQSIFRRLLGTASFLIQCTPRGLLTRRLEGVLFSTSPPQIGLGACIVAMLRRVPAVYWAMDLNPDQLIALHKIQANGWLARILEAVNRFILRHSSLIIVLDRFMADRLRTRGGLEKKLMIIPPWPHQDRLSTSTDPLDNPFRIRHGLQGKFVVMYSGNHSPSNPLQTLLEAAERLRDDPRICFLFVGAGLLKNQIESFARQRQMDNVLSLPYQPLEELGHSLSAADVHVVSLGPEMAGIIHPCKIYGAMAVARPILYLGPSPSHVSDLLETHDIGWHVDHGDVDAAVSAITQAAAATPAVLTQMGERASTTLEQNLTQHLLCGQFCDRLEDVFGAVTVPQQATREGGTCAPD
jgi:glycosyltransferase involved in cell wall biosynthesis